MENKKDYCSSFPEFYDSVYIGDCCKIHDNECGQAGSYSIKKSITVFYDCLEEKMDILPAVIITIGGTIGYLVKYPMLAYRKYKYNKGD